MVGITGPPSAGFTNSMRVAEVRVRRLGAASARRLSRHSA
jgi:hypothetical protein